MAKWEKHNFKVGEKGKDDPNKIELEGIVSVKNTSSLASVVFCEGISSHYEDYMPFLDEIGEIFDVAAFNHRGHGKSQGIYDSMLLSDDLDSVLSDEKLVIAHSLVPVTHSVGAVSPLGSEKKADSVFMINPYLGPDFLGPNQRALLYLTKFFTYSYLHKPIQQILSIGNISKNMGFHNKNFISDYTNLLNVPKEYSRDKNVGIIVSDKDEVIGTLNNRQHYDYIRRTLIGMFDNVMDYSHSAYGLNHCLNLNKGDLVPFMKREHTKDTTMIMDSILDFYNRYVEKKEKPQKTDNNKPAHAVKR